MSSVSYKFGFGESHEHHLLPYTDLESAKESQGVYAWFLRVKGSGQEEWEKVNSIYSSRRLKTSALGSLGERYDGDLVKKPYDGTAPVDPVVLTALCAAFSTPVYLGISSNVRTRLKQHDKALQEYLRDPTNYKRQIDSDAPSDTDSESSLFGARLGKALLEADFNHAANAFVKIVYLDNISRETLIASETLINRMIHPTLGRK